MKANEFIFSQPWAMLPEHVETMIALAERANPGEIEAVLAKGGERLENTRNVINRGGVAVVPIRGVISRYANLFAMICGGTSVDILARDIRAAIDDPNVKAIILEIDSPGGQAAGIGEIAEQIRAGTNTKPIVSYVSNMGASAAYWIASAGSEVVAAPSAMLGSVGVVWPMARTTDDGKTIEFVSSQSPNKRVSTETREGRAKHQAIVDALADVFIGAVAENRELTAEQVVAQFGAGGMLIGTAAVAAGMADRLGSLETLIAELSNGGPAENSSPITLGGPASEGQGLQAMKFKEIFAKWYESGMKDDVDLGTTASAGAGLPSSLPGKSGPTAREIELEAQNRELEAALNAATKANEQAAKTEAETWFAAQVKAGKALPAEKDGTLKVYAALANVFRDDSGLLADFKASIEARKPNGLTSEAIPTDAAEASEFLAKGGFKTLPAAAPTPSEAEAAEDAATVLEMLKATDHGRDILASRQAK